jgi:hypothetical protein
LTTTGTTTMKQMPGNFSHRDFFRRATTRRMSAAALRARLLVHNGLPSASRYSSQVAFGRDHASFRGQRQHDVPVLGGASSDCPFEERGELSVYRNRTKSNALREASRSHLCLFPSCRTATPCGEEYLTPYFWCCGPIGVKLPLRRCPRPGAVERRFRHATWRA